MLKCENKDNKKLLIIGNGFDRAHKLQTSYEDFKKHLSNLIRGYEEDKKSEECIKLKEIPAMPFPSMFTLDGTIADYEQERKIIYWLIDDVSKRKRDMKWRQFENYLGQLRTDKVIKKWGKGGLNEQCLRDSISDISGFFFEWVNTVDLSGTQRKEPYLSLIDSQRDIALSFNYTETLECVYGMDVANICYIHGQRETDSALRQKKRMSSFGKNNSELIVGFASKYVRNSKEAEKKSLLMGLYKDTDTIMCIHNEFFDRIASSGIKEIYSLGFSFSEADLPYIKKICDVLRENNYDINMTWFIAPHGKIWEKVRDEIYFRKCIRQAGFRGRICKFELDE